MPRRRYSLRGHSLRDEDGNVYRIPAALPSVPAGALVVVLFDGQGSGANDLNFGDGVATLHSPPGMVSILEDGGDQVALYNTSNATVPSACRSAATLALVLPYLGQIASTRRRTLSASWHGA